MKTPAILATLTLVAPPMMAAPGNPETSGTFHCCITQINQRIGQPEKENQALKNQLQQIQQVLNTKVDRAYELIPGSFTWQKAKADAEKRGGHLATITSEAEWLFIKNSLGDSLPDVNIWIGATDEGNEGHWRWVTGEAWGYTRWDADEPDNYRNQEHYAHISLYTGSKWNDLHNDSFLVTHYLLEK
ncbi:MAG: hypothetical protein DRR19_30175 [Candidatus Parabeggiatoa sp. nov. 1]|nr:MAG: hypothetical protein DRR19_30175 [Gammaproteobacteria bacterium]